MIKRTSILFTLALGVSMLAGCSSGDSNVEPAPKGPAPETQKAPPGVPGPQERTMANQQGEVDK